MSSQTETKRNWRNPLRPFLNSLDDALSSFERNVADASIKIVKDERFLLRAEFIAQRRSWILRGYIVNYNEEGLEEGKREPLTVEQRLHMTDELVRLSAPYLRAGDKAYMAMVLIAWEKIIGKWEALNSFKNQNPLLDLPYDVWDNASKLGEMQEEERHAWVDQFASKLAVKFDRQMIQRRRNARLVDDFTLQEIIPHGMMIVDYSYFDVDVTPQRPIVIQGIPPEQEQQDITNKSRIM